MQQRVGFTIKNYRSTYADVVTKVIIERVIITVPYSFNLSNRDEVKY